MPVFLFVHSLLSTRQVHLSHFQSPWFMYHQELVLDKVLSIKNNSQRGVIDQAETRKILLQKMATHNINIFFLNASLIEILKITVFLFFSAYFYFYLVWMYSLTWIQYLLKSKLFIEKNSIAFFEYLNIFKAKVVNIAMN